MNSNLSYDRGFNDRAFPAPAQPPVVEYYEEDEPPQRTLEDYLDILRRQKFLIAVTIGVIAAIAAAVAMLIPPSFRSSATVLIQDQEIPPDFVRTTVTSLVDERIQVISQQVMTRSVLLGIIEKYNLYSAQRRYQTNEEIIDRMRKDIKLTTISADVQERRDDRRRAGTIAFQISYESSSPIAAQRVVNELVSLYLNENLRTRQQRATETTSFLTEEAERLAASISEMEAKLADFKAKNVGRLPQNTVLNLGAIERAEAEVMRIDRELSTLEDRRASLQTQLAQVKDLAPQAPQPIDKTILEPVERLRILQNQFASVSGQYAPDHPDVRRLKREIEALKKETGGDVASVDDSAKELEEARNRYASLREKYADDHPDVQRQKRVLASLEEAWKESKARQPAKPEPTGHKTAQARAESQVAVTLRGQLEGIEAQMKGLRQQRKDLQTKTRQLEVRVEQSPVVEKDYQDLVRDYDNAMLRYRELKSKQMQAEVAQSLERERKGERFSLIDPAQLPEKPTSPNRPAILALGLVLSLGGGFGLGILRGVMDPTVRGSRQLQRLVQAPMLGAIPYVVTREERARQSRKRGLWWVAGGVVFALVLAFIHFFYMPLPIVGYMLARRIGLDL